MKFLPSTAFLLSLLSATGVFASPVPATASTKYELSPKKKFGIMSFHSGNFNVHLHPFFVGESGHVYLTQYDNADQVNEFYLKDSQLFHKDEIASLDKDGALVFKSSNNSSLTGFNTKQLTTGIGYEFRLNTSFPVACHVPNTNEVYQIYYGRENHTSECVGIATELIIP
ncbi:But2 family protein [Schizosaccharomyces octosporus yFS286]|uniref:But2 family protein n=1 Tax=Schizosaccharomyces octosporus (strain yFS286) TaxID=483514 RepID=S9Q5Q3_SCHOY|nr:But2 family protein [Schizosaccharomyces octosporus yFS286]EPX75392.1 But2 family protein [Schizosaccharomyces octosporus yFS286]